jgi:hypothetical protein
MSGEGRRLQPSQSGNPTGRPKGSSNVLPRFRNLVAQVRAENEEAASQAFKRALLNPKTQALDLSAKTPSQSHTGSSPQREDGASGCAPRWSPAATTNHRQ